MRVCPKCGYIDPPYWKHVKFSYFVDSCSLENFSLLFPNLAEKITDDMVFDGINYYRLIKSGFWVLRMAKIDVIEKPFGNEKFEKVDHSPYNENKIFWKKIREYETQKKLGDFPFAP